MIGHIRACSETRGRIGGGASRFSLYFSDGRVFLLLPTDITYMATVTVTATVTHAAS